ncbi:hypothetical protein VitviT2T_005631 [Vitis vinifera]|uniref:Retrovirus-related Pol polyprotein from transposon RE1 n=1 Tax=Vitis vinifera TaxID=29760 RepID=A0ABY9BT73_VITVI|nr:hypothetical protein VitviT2T_005631 [Vitis vinifera]
MATSSPSILTTNDSHNTLISINVAAQTPLKLTSTNYLSWKLQFHTLFIGYDLLGYIDGSKPSKTAREAWTILATTYAKPSRGRIKQAQSQLKLITKGSDSVTSFLQSIKAKADELALLGAPLNAEDLTDKILDGLGDEYRELTRAI